MPRGVRTTPEQIEEIRRLTNEGYTQPSIGDKLGIEKTTVAHYQHKMGLKASNRWRFGESASKKDDNNVGNSNGPADTNAYTILTNKCITLKGARTGFEYGVELHGKSLFVKPGYTAEIELDLKDIVAFGNELLDVADKITAIQRESWRV